MTRLQVSEVEVVLGGNLILDRASLTVEPGEWVGLLGPNGAGKTTLVRAIAGAIPYRGWVLADDRDLSRLSLTQRARLLAVVPQRPTVPPDMTVADYVLLGRTPYIPYLRMEGRDDLAAAAEAISALELEGYERRLTGTLSGGELQRAVLARAIAQQAPVLVLDEPTSSLDVGHQQAVLELVERLRRERGLTVLSALHDLTLAAQFCDRLVLLAEGRVVAEGRAAAVLTEGTIREHYGATVRVIPDQTGGVVVIPVREAVAALDQRRDLGT